MENAVDTSGAQPDLTEAQLDQELLDLADGPPRTHSPSGTSNFSLGEELIALADGDSHNRSPSSTPYPSVELPSAYSPTSRTVYPSDADTDTESSDSDFGSNVADRMFTIGMTHLTIPRQNILTDPQLYTYVRSGNAPLFVYGSKMFLFTICTILDIGERRDQWAFVRNMTPAELDGFDRFCIKDTHLAAALPHDPANNDRPEPVRGMLIFNLTDAQKVLFDRHNGIREGRPDPPLFRKIVVSPRMRLKEPDEELHIPAEMYIWNRDLSFLHLHPHRSVRWEPERFVRWKIEVKQRLQREHTSQLG